jgi:hypothetical protein
VGIDGGDVGEEGEGVLLLDEETEDGKHGETAVLELSLAQDADVENIGEALFAENISRGLVSGMWKAVAGT